MMIFSKEKWNDADEIRRYVSVSSALDFETMEAPLRNAFRLFIHPLLGWPMCDTVQDIYTGAPEIEYDTDPELLELVQRANALLAFWYSYDEINVMIGSAGVKLRESEKSRLPFKYQEESLKRGWKNKGFNALDDVLRFLEQHTDNYPEYRQSENFTRSASDIVRCTPDVDRYYFINASRLTYLRLRPHFATVENTVIAPRLGAIFPELKAALTLEEPEEKYTALRDALIPVVVFYGVRRLMMETGDLTDKGLYFSTLSSSDACAGSSPVADERITAQARQAEADALEYWKLAERVLKDLFGMEISAGRKFPVRDNRDKKSFWA
ncbi:MAG: hypothetical protein LBL57_07760 [Tannerella sp.]|jgi:hypothetical protein|nr:hypothetical protein [Tannerella sp.]